MQLTLDDLNGPRGLTRAELMTSREVAEASSMYRSRPSSSGVATARSRESSSGGMCASSGRTSRRRSSTERSLGARAGRNLLRRWRRTPGQTPIRSPATSTKLATLDESAFDYHEGYPGAKMRMLISVEGEDVLRLERIAQARGKKPSDVLAELLRAADP